jgi:anti-anti-sigma regulatory factor
MLSTETIAQPATGRISVFVDLIGDLDVTLANLFADTLAHLAAGGTTDVFLNTKHVSLSSTDGLAALDAALAAARAAGCSVAIDPGNRRMRSAFATARIPCSREALARRPHRARHLMIARHSAATALPKSA